VEASYISQYTRFLNKALLKFEVLRDAQLLNSQLTDIDADVLPHARSGTDCEGNPWGENNGFLIYTTNREEFVR
jgi:hypothetical protein